MHRISLIGTDEAAALNVMAQKFISTMSKSRQAEDKVVKALPTWAEPEEEDSEESSHTNLVNYHCYNGGIFYY